MPFRRQPIQAQGEPARRVVHARRATAWGGTVLASGVPGIWPNRSRLSTSGPARPTG
jgi:hypothetical protein